MVSDALADIKSAQVNRKGRATGYGGEHSPHQTNDPNRAGIRSEYRLQDH